MKQRRPWIRRQFSLSERVEQVNSDLADAENKFDKEFAETEEVAVDKTKEPQQITEMASQAAGSTSAAVNVV